MLEVARRDCVNLPGKLHDQSKLRVKGIALLSRRSIKRLQMSITKRFMITGFLALLGTNAITQPCAGTWSTNDQITFQCVTGQWVGHFNGLPEPTNCPVIPNYTSGQTNTFTFSTPVNSFRIDFNAFTSSLSCARLEIKLNGEFYPLNSNNLIDLQFPSPCSGSTAILSVTPDGYIVCTPSNGFSLNGQGTIAFSGVNASSVTVSTNDPAGSVFTNPYNCIGIIPLTLVDFRAEQNSTNCLTKFFWETGIEFNVRDIHILHSDDGLSFQPYAIVSPTGSNSRYMYQSTLIDGFVKLRIYDFDETFKDSKTISLNKCFLNEYIVAPNPTRSDFTISGLQIGDDVTVWDVTGRRVKSFKNVRTNVLTVTVTNPGLYFIQIERSGAVLTNLKCLRI